MEQETKRTDGVGQGSGLVPGVLGEVGAGAIPGVLPVQRGSDWVSDRPTPETDAFTTLYDRRNNKHYPAPISRKEWEAFARRLERERDEARAWAAQYSAEREHNAMMGLSYKAERDELRAEVERLREAGENLREHLVSTPPGAPLDVPDDIWLPFTKALAGKEGAPSQRLDLGDKLIHERDIARQWATELANALDGLGYPDRIQMEAFRQVEQGWKGGA
jgi:hypothetical protein